MALRTEQHGRVMIIYMMEEYNNETGDYLYSLLKQQLKDRIKIGVLGLNCRKLKVLEQTAVSRLTSFLIYASVHNIKVIFFDLTEEMDKTFYRSRWNKLFAMMSKGLFEKNYLGVNAGN